MDKMITFDNTEIAFKSKSDNELKKAYWLFKMLSKNWLVSTGKFFTNLALKLHIPIAWVVKPTIYSHFVGGETIEDCLPTVRTLEKYNVKAILDYSVEGGSTGASRDAALAETLKTIENAAKDPNVPFAVFKPTAFASHEVLTKASSGEDMNEEEKNGAEKFREYVDTLCKAAYERDIPILIDAEDYAFQAFIDEVIYEMMEKYNKQKAIVFNTLQMYRWDRLDFLKKSYEIAKQKGYFFGAKFVRGAYMERERERAQKLGYKSPIHETKEDTDKAYNDALAFCMEHLDVFSIFNGTHNEYSSAYLAKLMEEKGIAKDDNRIWFSQLYGMSDHISFNLGHLGYNVAKYVPYGPVKHVLPYLIRRAEENTSVAGQTSRELRLITEELKRRKKL